MNNITIYTGLACVAYLVLRLCITALVTRHNRVHQWCEDEVEIRRDRSEERDV